MKRIVSVALAVVLLAACKPEDVRMVYKTPEAFLEEGGSAGPAVRGEHNTGVCVPKTSDGELIGKVIFNYKSTTGSRREQEFSPKRFEYKSNSFVTVGMLLPSRTTFTTTSAIKDVAVSCTISGNKRLYLMSMPADNNLYEISFESDGTTNLSTFLDNFIAYKSTIR